MNILILGNGGREHTFAWKIKQSSKCKNLYVAPGNAGTSQIAQNIDIKADDFIKIAHFALDKNIDMIIVGPEAPLVKGITNFFAESEKLKHIHIIGPSREGAILEGSKNFSKNFMRRYNIPTAKSQSFNKDTLNKGLRYLESVKFPIVLKADGLAAGKGVIIAEDLEEAQATLQDMLLNQKFGEASSTVIIEDFMKGIELSVFVLTNGKNYKILPSAKDYKRIGEGDTGLNTGGMGAISPVPFANQTFMQRIEDKIIIPTIEGLQKEGIDYVGFIFVGIMKVNDEPFVVEYNVRMGDPETQVVLPRIENDIIDLFLACANGKLQDFDLRVSPKTATTVVVVSGGYPEKYDKNKVITSIPSLDNSIVFHAGTKLEQHKILTNGGRVMAFTGLGDSIAGALAISNEAAEKAAFDKKYYRTDIGFDVSPLERRIVKN